MPEHSKPPDAFSSRRKRTPTFRWPHVDADPLLAASDDRIWLGDISELSETELAHRLSRLRRALRSERQRGKAGHWSYCPARHKALLHNYRQLAKHRLSRNGKATG